MRRVSAFVALCGLTPLTAAAGVRPAYGGELRLVLPALPQSTDPALATSMADLVVARAAYDPLVRIGSDASVVPVLLTTPPEVSPTVIRLRLRPGIRAQDESVLGAEQVVTSLRRLGMPAMGSPYAALLLPVSNLSAVNETDIEVALAFPYPDWVRGLAHPGTGVVARSYSGHLVGTGAFVPTGTEASGALLFHAFADAASGRPFVDRLRVSAADSRAAARALATHTADVALLGSAGGAIGDAPTMQMTFVSLNPDRLGASYGPIRTAIETSIDPSDLVRFFVRTPALPARGLLPPPLASEAASIPSDPGAAKSSPPIRATLYVDASNEDHRFVAERIQVLLHDRGVVLVVRSVPRGQFQEQLRRRDYELAVVGIPALPDPGLALAQVVLFASGREAAIQEMTAIGRLPDAPARRALAVARAEALRSALPLIPLYASGVRLSNRPDVYGVAFDATGVPSLADLWKWEAK
jgi:peptide/nickel transport system substrate-binding protein